MRNLVKIVYVSLRPIFVTPTSLQMFMYFSTFFFLKCHFLSEIRKFVSLWIFAILLLFDVIQRNNFLGILQFLLLETENFTFDGCFLIK